MTEGYVGRVRLQGGANFEIGAPFWANLGPAGANNRFVVSWQLKGESLCFRMVCYNYETDFSEKFVFLFGVRWVVIFCFLF